MEILRLSGASPDELLRAVLVAVPLAAVLFLAHLRRSRAQAAVSLLDSDGPAAARRS